MEIERDDVLGKVDELVNQVENLSGTFAEVRDVIKAVDELKEMFEEKE